jgi:hypothetical protein
MIKGMLSNDPGVCRRKRSLIVCQTKPTAQEFLQLKIVKNVNNTVP